MKTKYFLTAVIVLLLIIFVTGCISSSPTSPSPEAALALSTCKQFRFPYPPYSVLNTGGFVELFWWEQTFNSTPVRMSHLIQDPSGLTIKTDSWNIAGATSPLYNPEDPTGANQGQESNTNFANKWAVPTGAITGIYTSRVRYYSKETLNGTQPDDFNWEAESAVTFRVEQPWQILNYNDLDGNGKLDAGEPGLSGWHFSVSGPGGYSFSGDTSAEGLLDLRYPTIQGPYIITETLLPGWLNTDPGGSPFRKTIVIPDDLTPTDPMILFGNQEQGR